LRRLHDGSDVRAHPADLDLATGDPHAPLARARVLVFPHEIVDDGLAPALGNTLDTLTIGVAFVEN
jgi:hypothetical protein